MRRSATYVGHDRVLLRTRNGYKMFADARDVSITPHLVLDGVYEEHTDRVLKALVRPGMAVLEIGANVGLFTLLMAHRVGPAGEVLAFECDPVLATIVRDNLEMNGLGRIGAVDERAVNDAVGRTAFFTAERHRGGGTLVEGLQQIPELRPTERRRIEVETTTIDRVLEERARGFDLVKIDAEGAESAIVRGGARLFGGSRPLVVMMEFAPPFVARAGADPRAQLEGFVAQGFALHRVDDRRRRHIPVTIGDLLQREHADIVMIRR